MSVKRGLLGQPVLQFVDAAPCSFRMRIHPSETEVDAPPARLLSLPDTMLPLLLHASMHDEKAAVADFNCVDWPIALTHLKAASCSETQGRDWVLTGHLRFIIRVPSNGIAPALVVVQQNGIELCAGGRFDVLLNLEQRRRPRLRLIGSARIGVGIVGNPDFHAGHKNLLTIHLRCATFPWKFSEQSGERFVSSFGV